MLRSWIPRLLAGLVPVILGAGCPPSEEATDSASEDQGATADLAGHQDLPAAEAFAGDNPELSTIAARLPDDWSGIGILAARPPEGIPAGAPAWTGIVAEVVDEDGQRFLRASGEAKRIKNPPLARTAAANRARAELATWLGTDRLIGSEILEYWGVPGASLFARVQIRVPANWQPGMAWAQDSTTATGDGPSDSMTPPTPVTRNPQSNEPERKQKP